MTDSNYREAPSLGARFTKAPPGYALHGESFPLIPCALKAQMEREAREADDRELQAMIALRQHAERREKADPPKREPAPAKPKALNYDEERERLLQMAREQPELDPQTQLQVFEPLAPLTLIKRHAPPGKEDKERNGDIYRDLLARGPVRRLAAGMDDLRDLDPLEQAQPHLREVIAFVRIQLARANRAGLYIPPILLAGEPGVGKTHFALELASTLGLPVHLQAMDTEVANAAFLGSDKKWGNSQMGVLFELIGLGAYANPMIILDELDKAHPHSSGGAATRSLHSLLEPLSAQTVRDVSLEIEFNASKVFWIATANEPQHIAAPLRSRFKTFWIEQPSAAQAIQMAQSMVSRDVPELAPAGFQIPERAIAVRLAHLSAREIYQALREAIAMAVVNERSHLLHSDLPLALQGDAARKTWLH